MPTAKKDSEESEVLTGEEVSLDVTSDVTDTDLVGAVAEVSEPLVEAASAPIAEDVLESVQETVSLPTTVGDGLLPPVDVLSARSDETTVIEEPLVAAPVKRRSLMTQNEDEPEVPVAIAPVPVSVTEETVVVPVVLAPSFDEVTASRPDVLAEATVQPTLPSRAGARWMSAILTLILTPVAWYLLSDAGVRLAFATGNPWESKVINPAALIELGVGLLVLALIALVAAQSSLGLGLSGILLMAVGAVFLASPAFAGQLIQDNLSGLREWNDFGGNIVGCLELTGFTGLLLVAGFLLFALALALSSTRRAGRREEAMRALVASTNPSGIKARWARKATKHNH